MNFLSSPIFSQFPFLIHGFGLREQALESLLPQTQDWCCFQTKQVHGNTVAVLESRGETFFAPTENLVEADSFISNQANVVCAVRTADCVPILLLDPRNRAVAAVHAGWRGAAQNIVGATLQKMAAEFSTKPADVVAAIGPAIGACCYDVGEEVVETLQQLPVSIQVSEKRHIDVQKINYDLLLYAGLKPANIDLLQVCTKCSANLASYRRDHNGERQWSFVALK